MRTRVFFLGTRETWARYRGLYRERGVELELVELVRIRPAEDPDSLLSSKDPWAYSSIALTSKTSAGLVLGSGEGAGLLRRAEEAGALIAAVGEGTAETLRAGGFKPLTPPEENVASLVGMLGKMLRKGSRVLLISSDRLEPGPEPSDMEIDIVRLYSLEPYPGEAARLANAIRFAEARAVLIAPSRTAVEALKMSGVLASLLNSPRIELHVVSPRASQPLQDLCGRGCGNVYVHTAKSFRDFMAAVLGRLEDPL